jgi:nucleoid-associated protein YgaU
MPSRYQSITIIKSDTGIASTSGKAMYQPTYYPSTAAQENDSYIITGAEDRLDLIAHDFYGDSTLWWVIAMVNNLEGDSMFPPTGIQLRIPANVSDLLNAFNKANTI